MRKSTQLQILDFPALRLYKKDFSAIFELLQKHFQQIKITVGEYELDNPGEIDAIGKQYVDEFSIKARDENYEKYIDFQLRPWKITVTLSDKDDPTLLGLTQKIKDILNERKDIRLRFNTYAFQEFLLLFILTVTYVMWIIVHGHTGLKIISTLFAIFQCIYYFSSKLSSNGRLYLHESEASKGFWSKNKEKIIVGVIVGVGVTMLLWIVQYAYKLLIK